MTDGRTDFDFIFGSWRVHNRKLRDNTDPACTEWIEFDATAHATPILGGLGHIDRIRRDDFEGFTLRQFDPDARVWRIWWASSNRPGHLDPPLEGGWRDGTGVFLGDDVVGGLPVRFQWTTDGADSARWQQEFSYDAGRSWRLNWVMELTRDPAGGPF